ncbi:MAG: class II aldolase/adducin family protein [Nitrospirota bacterium]
MHNQIKKYTHKLIRDRIAVPESIHFYNIIDAEKSSNQDEWHSLFTEILHKVNLSTLLFAKPSLPFADLLIQRSDEQSCRLAPKDSETKVFLHDIPFIREDEWRGKSEKEFYDKILHFLHDRKALLVQNFGIIATGEETIEQAFIAFSTVFHTTFVKYFLDLLTEGFKLPDEQQHIERFKTAWLRVPDRTDLTFTQGMMHDKDAIRKELCRVGRYTVEKGYVDSFFGNISYFDGDMIHISKTSSSLDELENQIVSVPFDYTSHDSLSASSELPAHKGIYACSNYHAVLHGHPKFSVILSMFCEERGCMINDCTRFCDRKRSLSDVPVIAGETGVNGLAKSVPPAIQGAGVCIALGHGIFSAGATGFEEAFQKMARTEDWCRKEYFRLLNERCKKTPAQELS